MTYPINTILHTKDGRVIGNAIVIGHTNNDFNIFNIIKTDYGHECNFTDKEINECFYLAYSNLSKQEIKLMESTRGKHKHAVK